MNTPTGSVSQPIRHEQHRNSHDSSRGGQHRRDAGAESCAPVLETLARRIGAERYARYFEPAARARCDGGALSVVVRSAFDAELLQRRFGVDLQAAALESLGLQAIRWDIDPSVFDALTTSEGKPADDARPARRPAAPSAARMTSGGTGVRAGRYTLEGFMVGESNRLASMTAERFVDDEAGSHRPGLLFIHGGCGIGKTHLLNGLAARFREGNPSAQVSCVTGEMFVNDFVTAVQAKRLDAFRKRYRQLDLLCIDDVQFIAGKEKTQVELLHTIEALAMHHGRLVLTADQHPKRIERLCDRLVSRCVAGMVAKIETPERGLRMTIARHLAAQRGVSLDEGAIGLLADLCTGSVRDLEGAVARLEAMSRFEPGLAGRGPMTVAHARRVLSGSEVGRLRRPLTVAQVTKTVCEELNVELSEVLGRGRHRLVVLARSMAALLSRDMTTMSFPEIARALNRRNHSTVVTACQRVRRQIQEGCVQDAGPLQGVMALSDLNERLREAVTRRAASGEATHAA